MLRFVELLIIISLTLIYISFGAEARPRSIFICNEALVKLLSSWILGNRVRIGLRSLRIVNNQDWVHWSHRSSIWKRSFVSIRLRLQIRILTLIHNISNRLKVSIPLHLPLNSVWKVDNRRFNTLFLYYINKVTLISHVEIIPFNLLIW